MTTSRKIYILILVLAIGVLIWDKAFHVSPVSAPPPAQAIPADPPSPQRLPTPSPDSDPQSAQQSDLQSLPSLRILPGLSANSSDNLPSNQRDVFQMSSMFQKKLLESRRENPRFQETLPAPLPQLKAILIADHHQYALLDEDILGPGQTIGPYRLVRIQKNAVFLEDPEKKEFRISIDQTHSEKSEGPSAKNHP